MSRLHGSRIRRIWPKLAVSGLLLHFEFTNGYEMLHKLETIKERCPIVFQGHPSNFKVTREKISTILTQIVRFRTKGRSQLSNPSDLPCYLTSSSTILTRVQKSKHFWRASIFILRLHFSINVPWIRLTFLPLTTSSIKFPRVWSMLLDGRFLSTTHESATI